ncbi:MAG: hypothetical protein QOH61_577 [Chloroflexota bacterium]|jgi:hypothetical protein|nr:hypothetical protein [Chloroflexota bacterium]
MQLPGGPVVGPSGSGIVHLAQPTGRLERLLDARDQPGSVPGRVTDLLAAAVAGPEGAPLEADEVRALSSGDRRYLLRQVLVALGRGTEWRTVRCPSCAEPFDVSIDHAALVPQPVGPEWPTSRIATSTGQVSVRQICGADEEAVAFLEPVAAADALLGRVVDAPVEQLTADERDAADRAVEDLGPDPILTVTAACVACGAPTQIDVDPYLRVGAGDSALLREVHQLARAYHWSEADILELPTGRRRAYLALVDATRGMAL